MCFAERAERVCARVLPAGHGKWMSAIMNDGALSGITARAAIADPSSGVKLESHMRSASAGSSDSYEVVSDSSSRPGCRMTWHLSGGSKRCDGESPARPGRDESLER